MYGFTRAFSALELVFVIIMVGILSAIATPYFSRDDLALASAQLISHIKYTQHLALSEDMFEPNVQKWFLKRWQIRFFKGNGEVYYAVYSDREMTSGLKQISTHIDSALDPLTLLPLFYCNATVGCTSNPKLKNDQVNLTKTYNIIDVSVSCKTNDSSTTSYKQGAIVFDAIGRPYTGIKDDISLNPYQLLLTIPCDITLTHSSGTTSTIRVYPETGYAQQI